MNQLLNQIASIRRRKVREINYPIILIILMLLTLIAAIVIWVLIPMTTPTLILRSLT